jgi:hypothetical protein
MKKAASPEHPETPLFSCLCLSIMITVIDKDSRPDYDARLEAFQ